MRKLQEIAKDYSTVKNYVYQRYGSIRSRTKMSLTARFSLRQSSGGLV